MQPTPVLIQCLQLRPFAASENQVNSKEVFDWLFTKPKVMLASSNIYRLMDDIATYEDGIGNKEGVQQKGRRMEMLRVTCESRQSNVAAYLPGGFAGDQIDEEEEMMMESAVILRILAQIQKYIPELPQAAN
ncbi:hypothetical protein Tsubulata_011402 [Turnera subulata]|uniref:Terpene synthase metal-binding domain-containing protein n=1 Tax=Turnera subulata TaxID=218843 RepID=A0A9Q0G4D8_9ROSI|nr:hypothetical protein Tsubulata_011402 [Turnera subulata]